MGKVVDPGGHIHERGKDRGKRQFRLCVDDMNLRGDLPISAAEGIGRVGVPLILITRLQTRVLPASLQDVSRVGKPSLCATSSGCSPGYELGPDRDADNPC